MEWIYANINHLMVPVAMLLAAMAVYVGFATKRRGRKDDSGPAFGTAARGVMLAFVVLCAVLLGMGIARHLG